MEMNKLIKFNQLRKQAGLSLIEILITTLILGVGLLGVASLQMASVSGNQEGFFTTQATSIAEDFASRMRAAKMVTMVPNSTTDHPTYVAQYTVAGAIDCAAEPANLCRINSGAGAADCTFADMAIYDRWEVCSAADTLLPQGKVRISSAGTRVTLVVDWDSITEKLDTGAKKMVNSDCAALTGSNDRNCVILELVP